MKGYYVQILKVLFIVLGILQFRSAHAQEFNFLNKFYFSITDTAKFQPIYYQQSLENQDSLIVGIYKMDHTFSVKKIIYFDSDKREIKRKEFHYDSLGAVESYIEIDASQGYEFSIEFHPNGQPKSRHISKVGEEVKIESFDELGNPSDPPQKIAAIPYGGWEEWIKYLQRILRYPQNARNRGKGGTVRVYFEIDKEGNIANPEIRNPEEVYPSLAAEALRLINEYPHRWIPAQQEGEPVVTTFRLPISFNIP